MRREAESPFAPQQTAFYSLQGEKHVALDAIEAHPRSSARGGCRVARRELGPARARAEKRRGLHEEDQGVSARSAYQHGARRPPPGLIDGAVTTEIPRTDCRHAWGA